MDRYWGFIALHVLRSLGIACMIINKNSSVSMQLHALFSSLISILRACVHAQLIEISPIKSLFKFKGLLTAWLYIIVV